MILIFSLRRPDVVSWGDLAVRCGVMNWHGLTKLSRDQFDHFRMKELAQRLGGMALLVGVVGRGAGIELYFSRLSSARPARTGTSLLTSPLRLC